MDQAEIREFVETYFTLQNCKILENKPHSITVELNPETDKDLGLRPFYWSYVENMGIPPQLLTHTYLFKSDTSADERGELLQFGSHRLHQIFAAAIKRGQYVRLYEDRHLQKGTHSLYPWLLINYKVEYICDLKKERIISVGFNLVTGEMWDDFFEIVQRIPLTPQLPAYLFIHQANYSYHDAMEKIEEKIKESILQENHEWAKKALEKYEKEKEIVMRYYNEIIESKNLALRNAKMDAIQKQEQELNKRIEEIAWQYKPRIEVKPINQGLIYLRTHPSQVNRLMPTPPLYRVHS